MAGLIAIAPTAKAALTSPVTVSLFAPGGATDGTNITIPPGGSTAIATVSVDTSTGLHAGDANDIGNLMLTGESITFDGNSILLHVAAGAEDPVTGALSTGWLGSSDGHARYTFSGLSVPGANIVGLQLYDFDGYGTSGSSGVVSGGQAVLVGSSQVDFYLDDLVFKNRGGGSSNAYGEFRIDLQVSAVPEPASVAMMAFGLAAIGFLRARSRRR